jgi:hypothetical protein
MIGRHIRGRQSEVVALHAKRDMWPVTPDDAV